MSGEQFKFRTRALHLPKEIYDLYDKICAECEPCQKAAIAPSRSRTSGLRAEHVGELTFMGCQVPLGTGDESNIPLLRNNFDQYHLQPKFVVGDQAFMSPSWEFSTTV